MGKEQASREEEIGEDIEQSAEGGEKETTEEEELMEMGFLEEDIEKIMEQREEILADIERAFNSMDKNLGAPRFLKDIAIKIAAYRGINLREEFPKDILGDPYWHK